MATLRIQKAISVRGSAQPMPHLSEVVLPLLWQGFLWSYWSEQLQRLRTLIEHSFAALNQRWA